MRARPFWFSTLIVLIAVPSLVLAQAAPVVVFQGTQVTPLGNATLSTGPSFSANPALFPNKLFVGGLSFSGNDGFRMHIGGGTGALVELQDLAATLPAGSAIEFRADNISGIVPCVRVARTAAAFVTIDPDFAALGASSYRMEIWNDGAPVTSMGGVSGVMSTSTLPAAFSIDLESVIAPLPNPFSFPAATPFGLSEGFFLRWTSDVTLLDELGASMGTGDELRLYPQTSTMLGSVAFVDVLVAAMSAAGPYTMGVDDLAQQMSGRLRRGTGGAVIAVDLGKATMTLPAGVLGGMQVDMHASQSGECIIWDIKDGCGAGDTDEFSVTGKLLTGGEAQVGRVASVHNGSQWTVTPDFSGSGSPDATVELFDDSGNLMGINPCVLEFSITTTHRATETGVESNGNITLVLGFPVPVAVNLGDGPVPNVRRIKMHSNAPPQYQYFIVAGRTHMSDEIGDFVVEGESNAFSIPQAASVVSFKSQGAAYGKKDRESLVINNIGASGDDGVDIEPMPAQNQLGVEWAPLGPPSAMMGQTDWDFVSRLVSDPAPVHRMSIGMSSNGSVVAATVDPEQSSTTEYSVILRRGGLVVAQYSHTSLSTPFAELPDWPAGVGYQVLQYADQPWSMWINLGYEMDVITPGGPPVVRGASFPMTKADLIEVLATNTANPGHPEATAVSGRFTNAGVIVLLDEKNGGPAGVGTPPRTVQSVLRPAYPNPFNPQTTLAFDLATNGVVSLKIYAVDGRLVATLQEGTLRAGSHAYPWNGTNGRGQPVASGVYLAELRTPDGIQRAKLNLLK